MGHLLPGHAAARLPATSDADHARRRPAQLPDRRRQRGVDLRGGGLRHPFHLSASGERMRPYVREVMRQAHEHGDPVMRPMFYGYPDDERSWQLDDQYLFGPDLLVAPVLQPGARQREVFLPAGGSWTELSSGRRFDGGQVVTVEAPLAVIPVLARND